jgi:hypothetical protein
MMEQKMKKTLNTLIFCMTVIFLMGGIGMATSNKDEDIRPPAPDEVHIAPNVVGMPSGRILLVRKDSAYCAIKFLEFWTGKTEDDRYAKYESYFQDDKSGNFTNKNVEYRKEELYYPKASWSLFGHPVAFGTKDEIKCGFIRLWWTNKGSVYFFKRDQQQGDYGIELAPTKWTDISQVNVSDPRLKWYRFDEKRQRVNIPVEQLWDDKEK